MKVQLFNQDGSKQGQVELPEIFNITIREDIVAKYLEAAKSSQPYSPNTYAGKKYSASGRISHRRHTWGGHYGKGISRVPRKTMWRRGTQFYWVGATVSSTRGGRRAHPPKINSQIKKINKKEIKIAMYSAIAATASQDYVKKRYETIKTLSTAPIIIESLPKKTKELKSALKIILGENFAHAFKQKSIRPGKGKMRGRKYKSNAGVLFIISSKEKTKMRGLEIRTPKELTVQDLYPLGRLTLFTKSSLEELENVA
ncbi:MAG: 50S ribosomal protein L4 [Nanoarchaeota archaeon]